MINTIRLSSRSVSNDLVFQRIKEKDMKLHQLRLEQIRKCPPQPHEKNQQRKQLLKQLKKSKKASSKIDNFFDTTKLQNKALMQRIIKINKRKSIHQATSLKNLHAYKSHREQQQKNEIKKQNIKLISKILEQKSKMVTKKDLKQEFKNYESQKNRLRKVHSPSQI